MEGFLILFCRILGLEESCYERDYEAFVIEIQEKNIPRKVIVYFSFGFAFVFLCL